VNTSESVSRGFERLQDLLLAMRAGDELWSTDLAQASGLAEHICQAVLEGLTRSGLMSREADGRLVRRTLDA